MKRRTFLQTGSALIAAGAFGIPGILRADDTIALLPDTWPSEGENPVVEAGKFAKAGPWKIGHSHYGLAGSTHTYQTAFEAEYEISRNKARVADYQFRSADLNASKQVADIEDLIAQKVDAIIIAPLTTGSAVEGIRKAKTAATSAMAIMVARARDTSRTNIITTVPTNRMEPLTSPTMLVEAASRNSTESLVTRVTSSPAGRCTSGSSLARR